MKLSKAQLSEIIHSGWLFLGRLLGTLMKVSLPLMKDAVTPLSKSLHIPLGLTAVASPADAENH